MRLSCVVRAHPTRRDLVDELLAALDGPAEVVWDRRNDSWDTGIRAWQAVDPAADWGLVIEDDAVVCRDLLAGTERALNHVPPESVVSLYLGDRTASREVTNAASRAAGRPWIKASTLVWGVAIAVPVASIPDMLAWCTALRRYDSRVYDTRIARYYAEMREWPAYYTWPSLVDHRQGPSLLGHMDGRRAMQFIGDDASALDVDWSGESLAADGLPQRRRSKEFTTMPDSGLLVARKGAVVYHDGRRVVIGRGVTVAEAGADIVRDHPDLWEALTVHYPAKRRVERPVETATAAPGEKRELSVDTRKVREWAQAHGYEISPRGKLPAEVVEAYQQANPE